MILALRSPSFLPTSLAGLLFENHLLFWIALAVLGVILLFISRGSPTPTLRRAGIAAVALAALWAAAALLVDSPGERLRAAHVGLARAAERRDIDAMLAYCQPHFSIPQLNITQDTADAKAILKPLLDQAGVKETTFTQFDTTMIGSHTAVTHFTAITQSDMGPFPTTWEVLWEDVPGDDWRLHSATLLKVGDHPAGEIFK